MLRRHGGCMILPARALTLFLLSLLGHWSSPPQPARATGSIVVDVSRPGHPIASSMYGIFFEEISHAGEGGLYAELIQNRGFEDSRLPPMCKLENGFIVPPRTPHFDTGKPNDFRLRWNVISETPAWSLAATNGAAATMKLVDVEPLTEATPHSIQVDVTALGAGGRAAVINEGFWGINVVEGAKYKLSFYARSDGSFRGPVMASLESANGTAHASTLVAIDRATGWKKYEATLTATSSDPTARLALRLGSTGTVFLDFVSLFPEKTWRDRPNGLRPDLAETI